MSRSPSAWSISRAIETDCPHVVFALLHGSAREGAVGPRSDVDIAVFTDGEAGYQALRSVTDAARAVIGIDEIDVGILNQAEPVYRFEALRGRRDRCRCHQVFERLSWLLTRGVHCCDFAVLCPVSPHQARSGAEAATQTAFAVVEQLVRAGFDLDFIDDEPVCGAAIADGAMTVADESRRCRRHPTGLGETTPSSTRSSLR